MLIRIVRMTFHPEALGTFLDLFERAAPRIREAPGCRHLELWQEARFPNCLATYSVWDDASALERYRSSEVFRRAWTATKPLFAAPPEAFSYTTLRQAARQAAREADPAERAE